MATEYIIYKKAGGSYGHLLAFPYAVIKGARSHREAYQCFDRHQPDFKGEYIASIGVPKHCDRPDETTPIYEVEHAPA